MRFKLVDIPPIFYSSITNAPFEECLICNHQLGTDFSAYVIEKAVKRNKKYQTEEIIAEYAICIDCYEELAASYSKESRKRIRKYFKSQVNLRNRRKKLFSTPEPHQADWIANCIVKGTPATELEEFQIVGEFLGEKMVIRDYPLLIGGEVMDEITQMLSNKTLDMFNDFYGEYLGGPPEFRGLFKPTPKMVLT